MARAAPVLERGDFLVGVGAVAHSCELARLHFFLVLLYQRARKASSRHAVSSRLRSCAAVVVAGRASSLVLSVEHFPSGRSEVHSAAANLEEFISGRASAIAAGFVGGVYFAVFLADLWLPDAVLQFWRVAGHCHAAGNRLGESGGTGQAMARAYASGAGGGGYGAGGSTDCDVVDLRKGAGERRYFFASARARKRFLPRLDGAHSGFDAAGFRAASPAFGARCRRISFWIGGRMVASSQAA